MNIYKCININNKKALIFILFILYTYRLEIYINYIGIEDNEDNHSSFQKLNMIFK
jgi:preprotein translocase subunit SecY